MICDLLFGKPAPPLLPGTPRLPYGPPDCPTDQHSPDGISSIRGCSTPLKTMLFSQQFILFSFFGHHYKMMRKRKKIIFPAIYIFKMGRGRPCWGGRALSRDSQDTLDVGPGRLRHATVKPGKSSHHRRRPQERFLLSPLKMDVSRQSQTLEGFGFLPMLNKNKLPTQQPITKQKCHLLASPTRRCQNPSKMKHSQPDKVQIGRKEKSGFVQSQRKSVLPAFAHLSGQRLILSDIREFAPKSLTLDPGDAQHPC